MTEGVRAANSSLYRRFFLKLQMLAARPAAPAAPRHWTRAPAK